MEKPRYIHEIEIKVRDYECDMQGIVNNANYQHYMEHARHEFLLSAGKGFTDLREQGIECVVRHVDIEYRVSLRSKDIAVCRLYDGKVPNMYSTKTSTGKATINCVPEEK